MLALRPPLDRLVLAFLLLSAFPLFAADPTPDFRDALETAVRSGKPEVVIPPGIYRLKPRDGNSIVTVHKAHDLKIIATGVTLLGEDLTRAWAFDHCRNVSLTGLTVDYDPLPFTQGKIVAIAADNSSLDVKLDAGYPRRAYSRIDIVDPQTRFRKRGMPFLWGTKAELIGEDTVRVTLAGIGKAAAIGDLASLNTGQRPGGAPHAVSISSCEGMVFEDVTVFSAPGFGIIENDGEGGMRYNRCRVVPGPKPLGATEERLLSSSWDAMQSDTMKRGPLIENCEIREAGDDSWSVQSSDYVVVATEGSRAVIAARDEFNGIPQPGDRLSRGLNTVPAIIATCRRISADDAKLSPEVVAKIKNAPNWSYWRVSKTMTEVTVEGTFPFAVGDSVYCPDRQGNGFVFRNNKVHSSGRILIKAGEGLIENNEIVDGHSGVTVNPGLPVDGAAGIANLVIRHNRFIGTGYFCPSWDTPEAGSISITQIANGKTTAPAGVMENIRIEGNWFEDIKGPAIVATSTAGLTIANNIFCRTMTVESNGTGGSYGYDLTALIWLETSTGVSLLGNRVYEPGEHLKKNVAGKSLEAGALEKAQTGVETKVGEASPPGL